MSDCYKKEIVKMIKSITNEDILKYIYIIIADIINEKQNIDD